MLVGRTNRRAFIATLGGAAAWPVVARGEQSGALPLVGVLSGTTVSPPFAAFGKGLQARIRMS